MLTCPGEADCTEPPLLTVWGISFPGKALGGRRSLLLPSVVRGWMNTDQGG